MTKRQFFNRLFQLLLLAGIAYFFAPSFIDSFKKFNPAAWDINYPLLIASLLLMQIVLYGQSAIWSTIITFFEKKISYNKAFKIAYLSQLGRYLPGRIWQLFGMIYLAGKEGITKEEATVSFILSQIFTTPPRLADCGCLFISTGNGREISSLLRLCLGWWCGLPGVSGDLFPPGHFQENDQYRYSPIAAAGSGIPIEKSGGIAGTGLLFCDLESVRRQFLLVSQVDSSGCRL
jgi:hypothetical protein